MPVSLAGLGRAAALDLLLLGAGGPSAAPAAAQMSLPVAATPEAAIDAANQAIRGRFAYVGDCARAKPADEGELCSSLIALRPADGLAAYMVDLVESSDPVGTWYFVRPVGDGWQVAAHVSAEHLCPPEVGRSDVPWPA